MKIAPSILSADFGRLLDDVKRVEDAGADLLHVDVMDGHFVPNITIGPLVLEALKNRTTLPLDVHLMIEKPERFLKEFVRAGADHLSFHVEATDHTHRTVHAIKDEGVRAGIGLNPGTPLTAIEWILPDLDFVVIMSVNPGFGGQRFIPSALSKIQALRSMIDAKGLKTLISVDGGINREIAKQVREAGADQIVAGSAIYGSTDIRQAIQDLRE